MILPKRVGLAVPCFQNARRLFHWDHVRHRVVHRKAMRFQHADHVTKIFRQSIARTKDVQLLLHEEARVS